MRLPFLRLQRTAFLAVLALLLAQAIGLAHGIAHPSARNNGTAVPAAFDGGANIYSSVYGAHDDGSAQCRLLDQLSHADLLMPALLPAAAVPPDSPFALMPCAPAQERVAPLARSRGPPSFLA